MSSQSIVYKTYSSYIIFSKRVSRSFFACFDIFMLGPLINGAYRMAAVIVADALQSVRIQKSIKFLVSKSLGAFDA